LNLAPSLLFSLVGILTSYSWGSGPCRLCIANRTERFGNWTCLLPQMKRHWITRWTGYIILS